jgi:prepilin-type N-terminal cleavage/methylation domain-containing protein
MKKGFTLIEMLVAIAVLSIVVFLSFSVGRSAMHRASYSGTVNRFISDVSSIKQLAAMENRFAALVFNNDGTSYTIQKQTAIGAFNWTPISRVEAGDGKEFYDKATIVAGIAVNSRGEIFKYPVGVASLPESLNIQLYTKTGTKIDYKKTIIIFSNGGIQIER